MMFHFSTLALLLVVSVFEGSDSTNMCPPSVQQVFLGDYTKHATDVLAELADLRNKYATLETRLDGVQQMIGFTVHPGREDMQGLTLNQVVVFDDVVSNVGGAYAPTTGIFTAPSSGIYVFYLQTLNHNNKNKVFLDIMKNGELLSRAHAGWSPFENGSTMSVTRLETGDTVHVQVAFGDAFWGGKYTTFSGFRVSADERGD